MVFLACFLAFSMIYCFDVVGLTFLGQDMSKFNICTQIYMPTCSSSCLCLDLCLFRPHVMLMLRSLCLYAPCQVCVFRSICRLLYQVLLQPFCPLISLFLVFWPLLVGCRSRSCGLGLYRHTQAYIKGFGLFPYLSMFVCQLLCSMSMLASLYLGFATLCALHGLVLVSPWGHLLVWLHLSLLGLVWM